MGGYAWVTLATNDAYSLGALVLAHSLRRVATKYESAVLVTPGVTQTMREKLAAVFSVVMEVNVLDSKDEANLALLARPELGITFTKLHCWRLTQYEKCVFLDADTLVVRNCDELFEREELSAAPDVGWPDCFNSGVFVYAPSQQTFASITAFAAAKGSFDGGDQGLLNMYFSDWAHKDISKHLPFIYNMCSTATYSYLPAFKQFGDDVRIIHFIGITKPWLQYFDTLTGIVQPPMGSVHLQPLLQLWWNIFCEKVHPQLSPVMATSTLAPIWHEFSPTPFRSPAPNTPVCTDIQDETRDDICLETPDFSEFKDPWENYCARDDPIINKKEGNETEQYYSTIDRSSPVTVSHDEFNCVKSAHQTHHEPQRNRESFHNQQYNEYNSPPRVHNQEQTNQFVSEDNYWRNERSVQNFVPVHATQNHRSTESQHEHVEHHTYHSCNDGKGSEERKQHQHVDYQPARQYPHDDKPSSESRREQQHTHHVPNNNNKPSEETKRYRDGSCVDYQHNQRHTYDNTNKDAQRREESNQIVHHSEHNELERKEGSSNVEAFESSNVHRVTEDNVVHRNDLSVRINTEQRENVTDEQTDPLTSTSPDPVSKPCTDIHNVATQSDPHITEDSSNAGLAGALAQMTLGEPRSAEQIALEEHMRKQSWEQGQIDYMGRDSFDNIWKKICQTLALAPARLPSPPKELLTPEETDKTAEPVESAELEATTSVASVDEVDNRTAPATTSQTEEQTLVNNVPITQGDNIESKLSEESEPVIGISDEANKSKETASEVKDVSARPESDLDDTVGSLSSAEPATQTSEKIAEEIDTSPLLKEAPQETEKVADPREATVPPVAADPVPTEAQPCPMEKQTEAKPEPASSATDASLELAADAQETERSVIRDEKHAKELSTASEVLTTSPVPIQVAESVLQVEAKESASDSEAMTQVLSSTITPVHESSASCREALTEVKGEAQMNGSAAAIESAEDEKKLSSDATQSAEVAKASESAESTEPSPVSVEEPRVETVVLDSSVAKGVETPEACVESSQEREQEEQIKETESCTETKEATEASLECAVSEPVPSSESPVRPVRAKELSAPATVEAELSAETEKSDEQKGPEKATKKAASKSVEKSTSEGEVGETTEGDSTGKKVVKKVVKKVTKKAKSKPEEAVDEGAQDSSASKQKKTVKVVKKGTKSSQASDTDATASEAPSSSASDAPVPPKRKSKSTPTKASVKKSDVE